MKRTIKTLATATITSLLLTACSSSPLQNTRLNKAEGYMTLAEQALATNRPNRMRIADNHIGTAKAYILTIRDNLKHLTAPEKARYQTLKSRADSIDARIIRNN